MKRLVGARIHLLPPIRITGQIEIVLAESGLVDLFGMVP
jgi:hypothetical protein